MNEEQFDHIADKFREAAEQYQPDFREDAWADMQRRLHPESKKRRFIFWWFLLPLLLVGAGWWYVQQQAISNQTANQQVLVEVTQIQESSQTTTAASRSTASTSNQQDPIKTDGSGASIPTPGPAIATATIPDHNPASTSIENSGEKKNKTLILPSTKSNTIAAGQQSKFQRNNTITNPNDLDPLNNIAKRGSTKRSITRNNTRNWKGRQTSTITVPVPDALEEDKGDATNESTTDVVKKDDTKSEKEIVSSEQMSKDSTSKNSASTDTLLQRSVAKTTPQPSAKDSLKKDNQSSIASRWYVLALGGGAASSVKFPGWDKGNFNAMYGLGIGYQFAPRWRVQTGFYVSRKQYIAQRADYNIKPGSYWDYTTINYIDANCMVYDIPLTLRYEAIQRKKVGLFVAAGLSSYLMKTEAYRYNYTRYYNNYNTEYNYEGNSHLFSVLDLSLGFTHNINQRLSVLVSPFVSVPLGGVGAGQIKLYSAGVLAGVQFQPFGHTVKRKK